MELQLIPTRYRLKVKERLAVLKYAQEHSLLGAGRRFGLRRATSREWRDRWRAQGHAGLVPRYAARRRGRVLPEVIELVRQARFDLGYGSGRAKIWLARVHHVRLAKMTIQRIFRDLGMPRLSRRKPRRPRQLKLFEKETPGESVQVDVKHVRTARGQSYQYTALDDCTRFRVLRLYRRCNEATSISFLRELRKALPFPIQRLQTDNGAEFSLSFALSVTEAGITHRYIRPRCPQQNGKVERSHRIDSEEFWGRHDFASHEEAWAALAGWEDTYNNRRFSMALAGQTPAEKLASRLSPGSDLPRVAAS